MRHKADRTLRKKSKLAEARDDDTTDTSCFVRARVDIRDLNINGLNTFDNTIDSTVGSDNTVGSKSVRPIVAVAKHLCGVATDLSLRSLLTSSHGGISDTVVGSSSTHETETAEKEKDEMTENEKEEDVAVNDGWPGRSSVELNVAGVCIATCCHHCCDWQDYVAKGYFTEVLGLNKQHFTAMCKLSGWACNSSSCNSHSSAAAASTTTLKRKDIESNEEEHTSVEDNYTDQDEAFMKLRCDKIHVF